MPTSPSSIQINEAQLAYFSEGAGEPVIFVHGAVSDHRFWRPQLGSLSSHYRCISIDQRYFGMSRDAVSRPYSLTTHASDLSEFVQALGLGPVHVVATSYGAAVALASAASSPDRFASLFLNEPTLSSLVTSPESLELLAAGRKELAPVAAALATNNYRRAVELFCDWTSFPGGFAEIPPDLQVVFHDNADTIPLLFAARAPAVTAADLSVLKMPITLTTGQQTKPFFRVQTLAARESISHSHLIAFSGVHHAASMEHADAFNRAIVEHITRAARTAV